MADAKTDIKQSDEWQKAVAYEITDADIDRQRALLGFDQAARTREYIQTATEDNIRNFAHGMGDDKPLYPDLLVHRALKHALAAGKPDPFTSSPHETDRKIVVEGKNMSVREVHGGRRMTQKTQTTT